MSYTKHFYLFLLLLCSASQAECMWRNTLRRDVTASEDTTRQFCVNHAHRYPFNLFSAQDWAETDLDELIQNIDIAMEWQSLGMPDPSTNQSNN